jgi:hypothetical protein
MKKPTPTKSMADMLMQSVAAPPQPIASTPPPVATPVAGERLVAFGQRITATHKEQLKRLAFWSRRNERLLLERALNEFFAKQDPEQLRPIPEE